MKSCRGFTLLELLVSLALFAVIYAVAYGTLSNILSGSQSLSEEQQRWRQMDLLFTLLQEDLRFASGRKIRDIDGATLPAMIGQPTDTRAVSSPTLEFSRSGLHVLANGTETGDRRIAYRLRENIVYREVWSSMDRSPVAKPDAMHLLSNVGQLEVRFLNSDGKWLEAWPDSLHPEYALPRAVEINIGKLQQTVISRVFHVNG